MEDRGRMEGRVLAAPMARQQIEKLAAVTTGSAETPSLPCAMVLTVSFALSLGTGLSCPHHRADRSARLDTSVGVSGPHDFVVRVDDARLASSSRPSHPASRSVTIGQNALCIGRDAGQDHGFLKNKSRIFLARGLDSGISVESTSEFRFFANAIFHAQRPLRTR